MPLKMRKLSHALGAEILDLKIGPDLSSEVIKQIHTAFLDHQVLLFRNQNLTHEEHIAFSRHFGALDRHDAVTEYRLPDYPEIVQVTNEGKPASKVFGRQWHSDHSMTLTPSNASLLRACELPEVGGDTLFSNMYTAYETLSYGMKRLLEPLKAVHTVLQARHLQGLSAEVLAEKTRRSPPVLHPVVRIHPETGRPALYVSEMLTSHFEDMTYPESRPLLEYLFDHSTKPELVYRHRWQKNDLLVWDNRCTMHMALADYDHSQIRRMFRTTIIGPKVGWLEKTASDERLAS